MSTTTFFMKHKADIGKCTIAKHRIELEPETIPHREGARRMSPDKAAKANQEVRNILAEEEKDRRTSLLL